MVQLDSEKERHAGIVARLQYLVATQEWDTYQEQLLDLESRVIEGLCVEKADARFYQGRIQGLREARMLPQFIISQMEAK